MFACETSPKRPHLSVPTGVIKGVIICALLTLTSLAIWTLPEGLRPEGRKVLIITLAAIVGWVSTRLPDSIVAIGAAVTLVLWGAVPQERLFATLGSELVWLLLAAFVMAAVLQRSGLVMRLLAPMLRCAPNVLTLFAVLTPAIAATAFLLPSTSARAALLLPVFLALVPLAPQPQITRALALLFPSVILLSAGSSLIGAGAHVVAVDAIAGATGLHIGYLDWLRLGAPLGFLASALAALLILCLFVPRSLWRTRLSASTTRPAADPRQLRIVAVLACLIGLWMTEHWHGISTALVALIGALVLLTAPFSNTPTKQIFRMIDTELLVFLAATMLIAQAMTATGTDQWLARAALDVLPDAAATHSAGMAIALSTLAVGAHLFITSRSARVAVLVPALALPVAGLGHDAALTVLMVTMGTGFCQTMMASAKPVAIFGASEEAPFAPADLLRLAVPLAPIKIALLVGFALWVWPAQLEDLRRSAPSETATTTPVPADIRPTQPPAE